MSTARHVSTQQARSQVYTVDSGRDAEARVAQDIAQLSAALDGQLGAACVALVLIGGYARGDGSVIEHEDELQACSPYEILVITRKRSPQQSQQIDRLARTWSEELGVEVRLHERTPAELLRASPALTWLDAANGGAAILGGDPTALRLLRPLAALPLTSECWASLLCDAARLVAAINLDDLARARSGPQHVHHAVLACGDAVLLSVARYSTSMQLRCDALTDLESELGLTGLAAAYADVRTFVARPDTWRAHDPLETFYATRIELLKRVHLALEARRVGAPTDPLGYALFARRIWSDTRLVPFAALSAALRAAREGERHTHAYRGDPRERLARCAVLLAYASARPEAQRLAARLLGGADDDERTPSARELHDQLQKLAAEVDITRDDPLAGARYGRP